MYRRICALLLLALLLAGCSGGAPEAPSESPGAAPEEEQCAAPALPEPRFLDDPASPYPLVEAEWEADVDGDGTPELIRLQYDS